MISPSEFLQQQDLLGSGFVSLVATSGLMQTGLAIVVAYSDVTAEVDMLNPYAVNATSMEPEASASLLRSATVALENHVTGRSRLSLNDYLVYNGLKVSQGFASLSGYLGNPIDPGNIE